MLQPLYQRDIQRQARRASGAQVELSVSFSRISIELQLEMIGMEHRPSFLQSRPRHGEYLTLFVALISVSHGSCTFVHLCWVVGKIVQRHSLQGTAPFSALNFNISAGQINRTHKGRYIRSCVLCTNCATLSYPIRVCASNELVRVVQPHFKRWNLSYRLLHCLI